MDAVTDKPKREWERVPLVFIERARCPSCESANIETLRTYQNGDDTVTRRTRCRSCGKRFLVVVE
jgi:transposase-like protein